MKLNIEKIGYDSTKLEESLDIENVENVLPVKVNDESFNNLVILEYLRMRFKIQNTSTIQFSYKFDNSEKWIHCSYDFIQHPITKDKKPIFFSISKV